ncbi:MAG TPA: SET domain-containing protein [Bacteroidia bacterium]|nr:SET domain-containing protein [Bacteroidia bacterium]
MAWLEKYLTIKKSTLPGAGKGLFTKVDIPKGTRIVEYKGRLQPWKDLKKEDGHNAYIFRINNRIAINALPYKKALGRFANDAQGLSRIPGVRNNSEYNTEGTKCFIDATRKINKGEEIFVGYGKEFWDLIRKIQKEKPKTKFPA